MEQLLTLYSEVQSRVRLRPNCNDPYEKEAQHPARQAKVERHDGKCHSGYNLALQRKNVVCRKVK